MISQLNIDFSKKVIVTPDMYKWMPSPVKGVTRMMLDRHGKESGRATSIVRYDSNSAFTQHVHTGGEEFFVLDGVFSDENGDYPKGSYVRNPIGTSHTPNIGKSGALIFVKLHQFAQDDQKQVHIETNQLSWDREEISGMSRIPLHRYKKESTALVRWEANKSFKSIGAAKKY